MSTLSRPREKKFISIAGIIALIIVVCIQFIRPEIKNAPVSGDVTVPENVKSIFIRACYDCPSNQTLLSWFDKISPVYWHVARHIREGRAGLNFSEWNRLTPVEQKGKL
jgi:Haem-binding domain